MLLDRRTIQRTMPARMRVAYGKLKVWPVLRSYTRAPNGLEHTKSVLGPLRNKYRGKRVVLMGNGPSLRSTQWNSLRSEFTIGLNRIYLLFDEMGFVPTFHVAVNELVIRQFAGEILDISSLKIMDWNVAGGITAKRRDLALIPSLPTFHFHGDILHGWFQGYTVTFAGLQLAYFLGFSEVILIGVDHIFSIKRPPNLRVTSAGADPNHFHPEYFGKGIEWQLPDLLESERSYAMARVAFEQDGRSIVDCTDGGRLTVFPKATLAEVLAL